MENIYSLNFEQNFKIKLEGVHNMSTIWVVFLVFSLVYGVISGSAAETGAAALEGAPAAVKLCLETGGLICLWSGVMEVLRRAGALEALSKLLSPLLRRLFPSSSRDSDILSSLASNVSANLLGLGNAATPMGIRAATGMTRLSPRGEASDELCRLVVINTASIQLLPTTAAALRASYGSAAPFDILPAVWLSSAVSVCTGLAAAEILRRLWS